MIGIQNVNDVAVTDAEYGDIECNTNTNSVVHTWVIGKRTIITFARKQNKKISCFISYFFFGMFYACA